VARARDNVIGRDGALPWRLATDLAHFKRTTMGHPVVMGRHTWEGLPVRPLPGRTNIVVSRDWKYDAEGARVYTAPGTALAAGRALARAAGQSEVFLIGGAALYETLLPAADRLYLTDVDTTVPDGDTVLTGFVEAEWQEIAREAHTADARNDHDFVIRTLIRRP
jgi:dihydrofolate reductase